MKDKQPPSPSEREFAEAWDALVTSVKQENLLKDAVGQDFYPDTFRRVMILHFTFMPGISQDQLLDGIGAYLKAMLTDNDFRQRMGWGADATPEGPSKPRRPEIASAPEYTKPTYHDYAGHPDAFEKAKRAWRHRMQMLGFDTNDL